MRITVNKRGEYPTIAHFIERKLKERIIKTTINAMINPFTISHKTSLFHIRLKYAGPEGLNSIGVGFVFLYSSTALITSSIVLAFHVLSCTQIFAFLNEKSTTLSRSDDFADILNKNKYCPIISFVSGTESYFRSSL